MIRLAQVLLTLAMPLSQASPMRPLIVGGSDATPHDQIMATVAGWGDLAESGRPGTSPDILQKVDVPLVDSEICNRSYSGQVSDRMICAAFDWIVHTAQ